MVNTYSINTMLGSHRTPSPSNSSAKGLAPPCTPRPPGAVFECFSMLPWHSSAWQKVHHLFGQLICAAAIPLTIPYSHPHPGSFILPAMVT